ncbi:hypothetical protein [Prosthecobacter sp.]|uniref:hypothetical protein n=1 Tax=Prosthecobacter sp. TaxID=1965333 RepID=UPI001DB169E9|nr:hypothetical protein [Prosthecobacter sp.]MCB1275574.1 hypothetical protein [Prosthecobacter sp.]
MINPFEHVNWKPGPRELRSFARSLIIGFPVIGLVILFWHLFRHGGWDFKLPLQVAGWGAGAGVLFILVPAVARPAYCVWYALSCTVGLVISNVLLSVFYFTVFTVIALLRRTLGSSPVHKGFDKARPTYWIDAETADDPRSYFRQY